MPAQPDAVMKTAAAVLRLLVILNLVVGAIFALTLAFTFHSAVPAMLAREFGAEAAPGLVAAMRLVMLVGLVVVPFAHVLLTRLRAMVATVAAGDPFVADNAARLKTIAWCLLGIQFCDLAYGYVALTVGTRTEALSGWTFSLTGWVAVLLLFVLARVFDHGTRLRDDLEGTV